MVTQDSWEEAITQYALDGCSDGQPVRDAEQGRPAGRRDGTTHSEAVVPQTRSETGLDVDTAGGRPAGRLGRAIDSLDVDLQIGWGNNWPDADTEDGLALQGVRPAERSPSRAWKREGKQSRDQQLAPDDARRRVASDENYQASLFGTLIGAEELTDPLQQFADAGYITDVVNRVKSGKEATVFCCRAHPSTGRELVAAKVYAIGIGAHYRMSKLYADGRFRVYKPDSRQERAIKSGKQHGKEMVFEDWVNQEYANLCAFHAAGADVPTPITQCGAGILMEYVGDAERPAPTLVGATLTPAEAQRLFDQAMRNIAIFLAKDRVHGDLSPYNMLLWKERLVVIDLPQVVHARWNDEAFNVLKRDIENVLQFFARRGVRASATELAIDLWKRYRQAQLSTEELGA